jgi:hypothetical protein
MEHSDTINELAAAMSLCQAVGLVAIKESQNTHLNSKYADLVAVFAAVRQPMADNGLSFIQFPGTIRDSGGGKLVIQLTNMLMHKSGQWLSGVMEMALPGEQKGLNPAQVFGLVQSYARRYGLCAVLGVATGDDRDAQNAWTHREEEPIAQLTDNTTWQELFDTGRWKAFPSPAEDSMDNMGDLTSKQLMPFIRDNAANGGNNNALTAASAELLVVACKARGLKVSEALSKVGWQGPAALDAFDAEKLLAASTAISTGIPLPIK